MTGREAPIDTRTLERLVEDVGLERTRRLLRTFMAEADGRMGRIRAAAADGDLARLRDECHTLKGSAGAFGAPAVEREASQIIAACLAGDGAGALGRVAALEGSVAGAARALEDWLGAETE
jgi:HPt (histidine-containing phosphotransfer) domain-containing protein